MGVDQVTLHDHSSDTEGGEEITPVSFNPGEISLGDTEQFTFGDSDDAALEYDPNAGSSGAFVQSGSPMRVTGGTLTAQGSPAISADGDIQIGDNLIESGDANLNLTSPNVLLDITTAGTNPLLVRDANGDNQLYVEEGGPTTVYSKIVAQGSPAISAEGHVDVATGSAIRDGGETPRFELLSGFTEVNSDAGDAGLQVSDGNYTRLLARSGMPVKIRDNVGNYDAVQYDPDPDAGVLRTPNAAIQVEETAGGTPTHDSLFLEYFPSTPRGRVITRASDGTVQETGIDGSPVTINSYNGLVDMSGQSADLRLAYGRSIEDEGGNDRLELPSDSTHLRSPGGNNAFRALDDGRRYIYPDGGDGSDGFVLYDATGGFEAFDYINSSSQPGTVRFRAADLDMRSNAIENASSVDTDSATINNDITRPVTKGTPADGEVVYDTGSLTIRDGVTMRDVGTTDVAIADITFAADLVVIGVDKAEQANRFIDRVGAFSFGDATVESSAVRSTPANRTYTVDGAELDMSVDSGEYDVAVRIIADYDVATGV
jgi:hypothetical protein